MIHSLDMEPEDVACLAVDRGGAGDVTSTMLTEIRRRAVKKLSLARELGLTGKAAGRKTATNYRPEKQYAN